MNLFHSNFTKRLFTFNATMGIIATASFASFLIPILLNWKLAELAHIESPPVLTALRSFEYQTALVASVSVSAPMYLELLMRLMSAKLKFVLPNAVVLTLLALPDFLILCFVKLFLDLNTLNFLMRARFILFYWLAIVFIKKYGGNRWSNKWLLSTFVFGCIARMTAFYKAYFANSLHDNFALLGIVSDSLAFLIIVVLSLHWYRFIFRDMNYTTISNDEYMCTIYVTVTLIACIGLYASTYSSPTTLDWYNWNANQLSGYSIMYSSFYVIAMVFEGRMLQGEMLQTKVRSIQCALDG